jgi:hypothetical protein
MPPNMPTISGDQNPHRKHDAKMSQSFLRVSLVAQSMVMAYDRKASFEC